MKLHLIISLLLLSVSAFCQNDIDKDTSLAIQYYKEAITKSDDDTSKVIQLEKAVKLYKKYPFQKKLLLIQSELAYQYVVPGDSIGFELANQTLELAKSNNIDTLDKALFKTHVAIFYHYTYLNITPKILKHRNLAYAARNESSDIYVTFLYKLNFSHIGSNEYEKSIIFQKELQAISENAQNDNFRAASIYYYMSQGDLDLEGKRNYESAVINYNKAIEENNKYKVLTIPEVSKIYESIANSYLRLNNLVKAKYFFNKSLKINPNAPPVDLGMIYHNLGIIHSWENDFESAIVYAKKAKDLFLAQKRWDFVHGILGNIAIYYHQINDSTMARTFIEESVKYGRNPGVIIPFADILRVAGEYEQGLAYLQESLLNIAPDFTSANISDNPGANDFYYDLHLASLALKFKSEIFYDQAFKEESKKLDLLRLSIANSTLAIKLLERLSTKMRGYESSQLSNNRFIDKHLEDLLNSYYATYQINGDLKDLNSFLATLERKKAAFLLETLTPSPLPDEIIKEEANLIQQKAILQQKIDLIENSDSLSLYRNQLFLINESIQSLINKIIEQYPNQQSLYQKDFSTLAMIQEGLDDKTLFIEYGFSDDKLFIFTASKSSHKILQLDFNSNLYSNISKLNNLLKNPLLIQQNNREQFINISHQIYQELILPIESELSKKEQLTIIVENQLFYLPFEVLLASNEKKNFEELDFLIKKFNVNYQYSATIYQQLKQRKTIKDKSLLAFAPVFDNGSSLEISNRSLDFMVDSLYRSIENNKFISLPNTTEEINTISQLLTKANGQTKILLKETATKGYLMEALQTPYQFVHLATHSLVNYQNPKLSALACFQNDEVADILLFANEIQIQNIQADLVVLSSCESGIGQLVAGEGLIALNRSFIYAGANNVMFSLWKVNDEYTSELMIDFYRYYLENRSYTTALRQAKLKMLQDPITANPRYWAAFVLMGE